MEPSCPLGTTRCIPQAKFPQKPYNKSFIDQVCSVKMAGYWPRSFFCEFMDLDFVSVHKHAKKELGQYPAILTSHLVNNPYVTQEATIISCFLIIATLCGNDTLHARASRFHESYCKGMNVLVFFFFLSVMFWWQIKIKLL